MAVLEKILTSACFLGERVRYNAEIVSLKHSLLMQWQQQSRLVSICPEVCGGLNTPRAPAEIQPSTASIINIKGENVSKQFIHGAQQALALCKKHNIRFALLKESSPSCGSTYIYDGSFSNKKIKGQGITTELLRKNGIKVFSEKNIEALNQALER